jgi:chromosome segregation ATPase
MSRSFVPLLLLGASAALLPAAARADAAAEARLRDALRSTTAQVRALEDERAGWQAKEAGMKKEIEALRAQAKAPGRSRATEREVSELRATAAEQTQAAARLAASLERCEAERADGLRGREEERGRLSAQSARLSEQLAAAEAKNERIYRVGKDLVDWMYRNGIGGEPFLGLRRVTLENEAQQHEDRLIDQRVKPLGAP